MRRLTLSFCALALAGCSLAHAESTSPAGSASAEPKRPSHVPDLAQPAPSGESSPAPTKSDWARAEPAAEVRVTDPGCRALRIREWYRVECSASHVSLVGGERAHLDLDAADWHASATFPARRGDRRVIAFASRIKWSLGLEAIASEQWLEGDRAPLITVTGVH